MAPTHPHQQSAKCIRLMNYFWMMVAVLLTAGTVTAKPLRITSWDLSTSTSSDETISADRVIEAIGSETIEGIQKLNPDVILLQHAPDLEGCIRLAAKLKPAEYQVLTCSNLRDGANRTSMNSQFAILAKKRAIISWSDVWPDSESALGYAFAATSHSDSKADSNIGLFSMGVVAANEKEVTAQSAKLLETLKSVQSWNSNQLRSVLITGYLEASGRDVRSQETKFFSNLVKQGFHKNLDWLPQSAGGTAGDKSLIFFIYSKGVTGVENLVFTPVAGGFQKPVSCDAKLGIPVVRQPQLQTVPVSVIPVLKGEVANFSENKSERNITPELTVLPETVKQKSVSPVRQIQAPPVQLTELKTSPTSPAPSGFSTETLILIGISLIGLLCIGLLVRVLGMAMKTKNLPPQSVNSTFPMRQKMSQSQSENLPATAGLTDAERSGAVSHLVAWMKQKMIQRLISERKQFAQSQDAATLAVIKIDERLTQVELDMKERNRQYEQRIGELLKELSMAQEENRELIRAKIELLKMEMQKPSKLGESPQASRRN